MKFSLFTPDCCSASDIQIAAPVLFIATARSVMASLGGDAQIEELTKAILTLSVKIEEVEVEISACSNPDEKAALRRKEEQLRKKEEQLRSEKEQLREERLIQLRAAGKVLSSSTCAYVSMLPC